MSFCSPFSPPCYPHDQIFVLVFESFVIISYVRPTSRPKCLVMHLKGLEWFCGYPSPGITSLVVTLASPYLEVALSGCLLFLQLFLEGGYEKNFFF